MNPRIKFSHNCRKPTIEITSDDIVFWILIISTFILAYLLFITNVISLLPFIVGLILGKFIAENLQKERD